MQGNRDYEFRKAIKVAAQIKNEGERNQLIDHIISFSRYSAETRAERGVRLVGYSISILIAALSSVLIMWLLYDSYKAGNEVVFMALLSSSLAGIVIGGVATYFIKK